MTSKVHFSSASGKWETPVDLVEDLATVFQWDLDVCASRPNVCENYYIEAQQGLSMPWEGLCWMNPPYGRGSGIWHWMARAKEVGSGVDNTVVCLLPARPDTKWWNMSVPWASLVVFIEGRLKFGDAKSSAPFPSVFVVFGLLSTDQEKKLCSYGWTVYPRHCLVIRQMRMDADADHKLIRVMGLDELNRN